MTALLLQFGGESKTKSNASQDLSGILEPVFSAGNSSGRLNFTPTLFELTQVPREVVQGCCVPCVPEGATLGGHLEKRGFPYD